MLGFRYVNQQRGKMKLICVEAEENKYLLNVETINSVIMQPEKIEIYQVGDSEPFIIRGEKAQEFWNCLQKYVDHH
jgi:hypothetical protein